jgi:hypothetical protein|uniref:Uncharacterized protein n=1 Tax=Sipha flava TaxID=143950 RepID=A0A2S2QUA1_9HEMI
MTRRVLDIAATVVTKINTAFKSPTARIMTRVIPGRHGGRVSGGCLYSEILTQICGKIMRIRLETAKQCIIRDFYIIVQQKRKKAFAVNKRGPRLFPTTHNTTDTQSCNTYISYTSRQNTLQLPYIWFTSVKFTS